MVPECSISKSNTDPPSLVNIWGQLWITIFQIPTRIIKLIEWTMLYGKVYNFAK